MESSYEKQSEKLDLLSIIDFKNLMNKMNEKSFEIKNEEKIYNSENEIIISYFKKGDIPQIKIKNKNLMVCDGEVIKLKILMIILLIYLRIINMSFVEFVKII